MGYSNNNSGYILVHHIKKNDGYSIDGCDVGYGEIKASDSPSKMGYPMA
jgi:hypothetical protein